MKPYRANLCKCLKVLFCSIPLMQILFPHYIEINYIDIKKKKKKLKKRKKLCTVIKNCQQ